VLTSCLSPMRDIAAGGACLVNPLSVDEIRAGIRKLIGDEQYRSGLIEAGWKNVRRFGALEIAREYADLYAAVASSSKS